MANKPNPEDAASVRRRQYESTLARLVPQLVQHGDNGGTSTATTVDNLATVARLVADAVANGAATAQAVGDIDDVRSAITDAVMRLYVPHMNIPFSIELFELVRITVSFTYGWCGAAQREAAA